MVSPPESFLLKAICMAFFLVRRNAKSAAKYFVSCWRYRPHLRPWTCDGPWRDQEGVQNLFFPYDTEPRGNQVITDHQGELGSQNAILLCFCLENLRHHCCNNTRYFLCAHLGPGTVFCAFLVLTHFTLSTIFKETEAQSSCSEMHGE